MKKPFYKRWWVLTIVGVIVISAIFGSNEEEKDFNIETSSGSEVIENSDIETSLDESIDIESENPDKEENVEKNTKDIANTQDETDNKTKNELFTETENNTNPVSGSKSENTVSPDQTEVIEEKKTTLYSLDGRTIEVTDSEVSSYLAVGWFLTLAETQQTLYAPDGRTITVFKAEVPAQTKVGWYETKAAAEAANKPEPTEEPVSSTEDEEEIVYVGKTGSKYHYQNCRTLKGKGRAISLKDALAQGRQACKVCH